MAFVGSTYTIIALQLSERDSESSKEYGHLWSFAFLSKSCAIVWQEPSREFFLLPWSVYVKLQVSVGTHLD